MFLGRQHPWHMLIISKVMPGEQAGERNSYSGLCQPAVLLPGASQEQQCQWQAAAAGAMPCAALPGWGVAVLMSH